MQLTREQAIILTAYTGFPIVERHLVVADVERRINRPLAAHELPALGNILKGIYHNDFIAMRPPESVVIDGEFCEVNLI